jgi:tetratricopeptide (TPR) repeat protein
LLDQGWNGLVHGISSLRPRTLGQRLLTEPRVLMDYLDLLWLPRPFTPGLFNDQIKASTSLWSPLTTLPALMAGIGLIICAWHLHRRWPAAALAILFFFVGQSLESSTVALELYFEHRNYLPAMLMFWPLALWLCSVRQSPVHQQIASSNSEEKPAGHVALKTVLAVIVILGLATMTHARAALWGNSHDQSILWATLNPDSPRAQANAAAAEMSTGAPARAAARLHAALARDPTQAQLALNLFAAQCQMGHVEPATLEASAHALQTTRDPGALLTSWFGRAIDLAGHPPCPELTLPALARLLDAGLTNPLLASNPGRRQDLHYLRGRIALAQGNASAALLDFNRALDQQVRISAALKQAALLGSAGYPNFGLAHLDHYESKHAHVNRSGFGMPRIHAWVLARQKYMENEFAQLRSTLLADEQAKKNPSTP